ncbi:MAG: glycosyltransferase family 4 protein [Anaerolineaceae bacterium]|nr:glycosyltransferase family 4 protein [Anaerolineaceae bacterium]
MSPAKHGKLCLVANTDWYLYNFRLTLARKMRELGWEVVMVSPSGPYVSRIAENGFRWEEWKFDRRGLNVIFEFGSMLRLIKIYAHERPRLIHHFTIKPVIYGTLAARILRTPAIVNSITGLGYVFLKSGWQGKILQNIVKPIYSLALKHQNVLVIFENGDDQNTFLHSKLVRKDQTRIIPGVGVDVSRFIPKPEAKGKPLVVLPGRLLWDKGVGVLVEAARQLKGQVELRIALVGMPDPGSPASIPLDELRKWVSEGLVEHWGFRLDMEEVYRQAHIICLPSMGEGLPTVLIEAAAAGRPIITADVPGCREVVEHGVNGLLVPPNDPHALADALKLLAGNPVLRRRMGKAGRQKVIERFSDDKIITAIVKEYSDLLCDI